MILVYILIFNIAYPFFLLRLRLRHNDTFLELGSPTAVRGIGQSFVKAIVFLFKLQFLRLKDNLLTVLSLFIMLMFILAIKEFIMLVGYGLIMS